MAQSGGGVVFWVVVSFSKRNCGALVPCGNKQVCCENQSLKWLKYKKCDWPIPCASKQVWCVLSELWWPIPCGNKQVWCDLCEMVVANSLC